MLNFEACQDLATYFFHAS